jgi:hypothetical protein
MIDLTKILIDGAILSFLASAALLLIVSINPRLMLQDYPKDIQASVPPKTPEEDRLSKILGIPFIVLLLAVPLISTFSLDAQSGGNAPFIALFANAFGVAFIFNLVDWLILDWLLFCTLTPKFLVIPGTEGHPGYKNYFFHFRGFLIGTVFSAVAGLIFAGIVYLV